MKTLKPILSLLLIGGLTACAATTSTTVDNSAENASEVESLPEVDTKPEVEIEPEPPVLELKAQTTSDGKLILGEEEWVYLPGLNEVFKSRIDTGAATSSISAVDVVVFERDGKAWVKFKIEHDGLNSEEISLPVERWVRIRQSTADETQKRAVVVAWLQVGDFKEKTEFTLTDRTHLTFPLLLGRSFFKDVGIVDVSRKYVQDKPEVK